MDVNAKVGVNCLKIDMRNKEPNSNTWFLCLHYINENHNEQRYRNEKKKIEIHGARIVAIAIADMTRLILSEKGSKIAVS